MEIGITVCGRPGGRYSTFALSPPSIFTHTDHFVHDRVGQR